MAERKVRLLAPITKGDDVSIRVRKIANGWIISEERGTKKGFETTETFRATRPAIATEDAG